MKYKILIILFIQVKRNYNSYRLCLIWTLLFINKLKKLRIKFTSK